MCLNFGPQKKSHFIPAALYKTEKGRHRQGITASLRTDKFDDLKDFLLCGKCEKRFNAHGESWVLKWIAPKSKRFPLLEKLRVACPREQNYDRQRHSGIDLGIDTEVFAYFALSIIWRAAIHQWRLPDGEQSGLLDLGAFRERVRQYLAGQAVFPSDVSVMVTACTDSASRHLLHTPSAGVNSAVREFGFLTRGIYFRVVLDRSMGNIMRANCCYSSGFKSIFMMDCGKHTKRIIGLFPAPLVKKLKDELFPDVSGGH